MSTLIKIDKNGSKHYEGFVSCDRCGGDGVYKWGAMISYGGGPAVPQYAGTCFKCGGSGKIFKTWIERTPEYQAKLDAKRKERHAKEEEKRQAERAKWEAEQARLMAQRLKEKAEREEAERKRKAISQYVGQIGDKLTTEVLVEHIARYEIDAYVGFGKQTMSVYTFVDESGNKLVWKTSSYLGTGNRCERDYKPIVEGDRITIKGTVKGFGAYKGERQTELQRVRLA
jgi:hypothetical protein